MLIRNIHTSLCLYCFSFHKTTFLFLCFSFFFLIWTILSSWSETKHSLCQSAHDQTIKMMKWQTAIDKCIAPRSCWVTSVVEWQVKGGIGTILSRIKWLKYYNYIERERLTLKTSLQHQSPIRMAGQEGVKVTENSQRERSITGLRPGKVVCVLPGHWDVIGSVCSWFVKVTPQQS